MAVVGPPVRGTLGIIDETFPIAFMVFMFIPIKLIVLVMKNILSHCIIHSSSLLSPFSVSVFIIPFFVLL